MHRETSKLVVNKFTAFMFTAYLLIFI